MRRPIEFTWGASAQQQREAPQGGSARMARAEPRGAVDYAQLHGTSGASAQQQRDILVQSSLLHAQALQVEGATRHLLELQRQAREQQVLMNYEVEQSEREKRRRMHRERARTQTQQAQAQAQSQAQLQMQLETQEVIFQTRQRQRAQREARRESRREEQNRHGERRGAAPATSGHVATRGSCHVAAPATSGHVATRGSIAWMTEEEEHAMVDPVGDQTSASDARDSIRVIYSSY